MKNIFMPINKTHKKIISFSCFCFFLVLLGCSNNSVPKHIKEYLKDISNQSIKPIEEIPPVQTAANSYKYSAQALRNPFARPALKDAAEGQPDLARAKEPLEEFPLDSLHLVGIISKEPTTWAIISAPNGYVYPITNGGYLGQHFGQVTEITPAKIVIVENVRVGEKWKKQPVSLSLYE